MTDIRERIVLEGMRDIFEKLAISPTQYALASRWAGAMEPKMWRYIRAFQDPTKSVRSRELFEEIASRPMRPKTQTGSELLKMRGESYRRALKNMEDLQMKILQGRMKKPMSPTQEATTRESIRRRLRTIPGF